MTSVAPMILRDSNHMSIHLAPSPVVARVATPDRDARASERSAKELAVANHLARAGAPVASPTVDIPSGPHFEAGFVMTLWQLVAHRAADESDALVAAASLRAIHAALSSYEASLPPFETVVDECHRLLRDADRLSALARSDKLFLLAEHDRLRDRLGVAVMSRMSIHGDPHLGNVLMSTTGPRWTDWESACIGPVEWDLSCLPEAAATVIPAVDTELLALLRDLRNVCVAVWCWDEPDRAPEKRRAAEYHLRRLWERSGSARTV